MDDFPHFKESTSSFLEGQARWTQPVFWDGEPVVQNFVFPANLSIKVIRAGFKAQGIKFRSEGATEKYNYFICSCHYRKPPPTPTPRPTPSPTRVTDTDTQEKKKKKEVFKSLRIQDPHNSCPFSLSVKQTKNGRWRVTRIETQHHNHYSPQQIVRNSVHSELKGTFVGSINELSDEILDLIKLLYKAHTPTRVLREVLRKKGICVTKKLLQNVARKYEINVPESLKSKTKG